MKPFTEQIDEILRLETGADARSASPAALYSALSRAPMERLRPQWKREPGKKRACYFSAEFLVGRLVHANLFNLGLLDECSRYLLERGVDPAVFEQIEDDALGNGGLGRLAACFLDSAASMGVPLDGYGIRYRYGLFRQHFENGFQMETPDNWLRFGDPWSVRRDDESVLVTFSDQTVRAVP